MAEISREEAKRLIHEAGLRSTAPRIAVLRTLAASRKPLSHSEVIQAIGVDEWDQATLYRNLLKLVEVNLARVASQLGGVIRYEVRDDDEPHHHPHFACRTCGEVECLPDAKLGGTLEKKWQPSLVDSQLHLVGDCPNCLKAKGKGIARAGAKRAPGRSRRS